MRCHMNRIGLVPEGVRILVYPFNLPCLNEEEILIEVQGDHVDILGRSSLNDLILRVAGGKGQQIQENIQSNILEYAEKVQVYEED